MENKGPFLVRPLKQADQIERLSRLDPTQLRYVYDTIRLVRRELDGENP